MSSNSNKRPPSPASPGRVSKKIKTRQAETINQQQIARSLKTFQSLASNKEKAFYLCHCTETGLDAFSQLFKRVLRGRLPLPDEILKQLKPFNQLLRTIISSRVPPARKRKILTNVVVRSILYPFLRKYIIPLGLKWLSKVTGQDFLTDQQSETS